MSHQGRHTAYQRSGCIVSPLPPPAPRPYLLPPLNPRQVEALYLTLLQASQQPDPAKALARSLEAKKAKIMPTAAERLRLAQESLPLTMFAIFLRDVQGETLDDKVRVGRAR